MPHKKMRGVVLSRRMKKTAVVAVTRVFPHPLYGKYMKRVKTYKVHDEGESSAVGDVVEIAETRPLSREKRWRLLRVLEHAKETADGPTS